ncbi:hypothetical protein AHF37_10391 [Paragonimus kellicotti]|nr:hypothetical protein AHF37_10391 [Paragonimus kellicotti]
MGLFANDVHCGNTDLCMSGDCAKFTLRRRCRHMVSWLRALSDVRSSPTVPGRVYPDGCIAHCEKRVRTVGQNLPISVFRPRRKSCPSLSDYGPHEKTRYYWYVSNAYSFPQYSCICIYLLNKVSWQYGKNLPPMVKFYRKVPSFFCSVSTLSD